MIESESWQQVPDGASSEIEPINLWGFSELQSAVGNTYEAHDAECGYTADTMMAKLLSNAATLQRIAERTPKDIISMDKSLTNVLIWTATVANYGQLNLFEPIMEKFAAGCPRCHQMPCNLADGKLCVKDDAATWGNIPGNIPLTIDQWQTHLAQLYPNNFKGDPTDSLRFTSGRLLSEVIELITSAEPSAQNDMESVSQHDTHDSVLRPWRGEFADVLAWTIATGEAINRITGNYSIEKSVRTKYEKGCPYCKNEMCECPQATTILEELHRWEAP